MPLTRPLAILLLLGLLLLFAVQRCGEGAQSLSRSRLLMGTVVEITAFGESRDRLDTAVSEAFSAMAQVEQRMSSQLPQSDVSHINNANGPVEIHPDTAAVLELGQRISLASGGAFDLTLGRLKALWAIEGSQPRIPSAAEISTVLNGIGPDALSIEGNRVQRRSAAIQVDLGGIAKGYAVDRAIEVLRQAGVTRASVNAGGDIRLLGDHQGRPWRIGIQHPRNPQALLATLELESVAVVTSGDYERFFEREGIRYHHLFDPATGYPATRCQSVTLVAATAAEADALATAAFVLGPEAGLKFIDSWPQAAALLVAADGSVSVSTGLKDRLQWP